MPCSQHFHNTFIFRIWIVFYSLFWEKCYIHCIFRTNSKWQVVIRFKLSPLLISPFYPLKIPYHIKFIVKLLWKCYGHNIFYFILFWCIRNRDLGDFENIVTRRRYYNIFIMQLFLVVIGPSLLFYYFILTFKKLIPQ